jgi:hypothetical protein
MDIPLSLPVEQVGALALAIPSVSFILVQLLKSLFYWLAPVGWQERLPDKRVWMGCAFAFCIAACVALKMDIPQHIFPDWPASIPWWLSAAVSGLALGYVQIKVFYPLTTKPEINRKAAAAVVAACGPPAEEPIPEPEIPLEPLPEPEPYIAPVEAPEQSYRVRVATVVPLPDDARWLLFTRSDGKAVWMELES